MVCKTLCELEPKAETQKNQGAVVLVSASSTGCADWASTQHLEIDSQTHAQLAAWCVASYARLMNKAEKAHQYGAAIGALNGLVRLVVEPQMQIANKRTFNGRRS